MSIFPLKLGVFFAISANASSEFLIRLIKTLFNCSTSPLIMKLFLFDLN